MNGRKLTISYDDVTSQAVDERLRRQEQSTRDYRPAPPPTGTPRASRPRSLLYNTAVYTALFGLLGGILGWACGAVLYFRPNDKINANELMAAEREIRVLFEEGRIPEPQFDAAIRRLERTGADNPYFRIARDPKLTDDERRQAIAALDSQNAWADFIANVLFYSVAGMMIATCLAMADAVVERNAQRAIIYGSVGAILGLAGGVVVSLFVDRLYFFLVGGGLEGLVDTQRAMLARMISWGALGAFLALAPGLVMRNGRKLLIGLVGGAIGGILGGLLFDPIAQWTDQQHLSRLVGICAIGAVTGLSTGLIENAAKRGWLIVQEGLIAGKQFVLYRNPTYIGSALSCSIYLFRDAQVGPRHAAIHIVPGGFELEDLPLGTSTFVNNRPVGRHRLRNNDQIRIGDTVMVFHEKKAK